VSEKKMQQGGGESDRPPVQTVPHTQEDLSKHLMDIHPDDGFPEASDEA